MSVSLGARVQGERVGSLVVPVLPFRTALFAYLKDTSNQNRFAEWSIEYARNVDSYSVTLKSDYVDFENLVPLGLWNRKIRAIKPIFGASEEIVSEIKSISYNVDKCDICNTRKARNLYLLWDKGNEKLLYVAANCLKKLFKNKKNPDSIVRNVISYVESSPADLFHRTKESYAEAVKVDTTRVLAAALFLVQKSGLGYISKKQQAYGSTANEMERILIYENSERDENEINDMLIEAAVLKQCIIEEVEANGNEFIEHLKDVLNENKITQHSFGVVAAAPTFYEKFSANKKFVDAGRFAPGEGYAKGFVGEVGDKVTLDNVYIEEVRKLYSGDNLVSFRNQQNNKIVWFTSSSVSLPEVGVDCRVTGLVKKHATYRNTDSTVLSRCKVSPL